MGAGDFSISVKAPGADYIEINISRAGISTTTAGQRVVSAQNLAE